MIARLFGIFPTAVVIIPIKKKYIECQTKLRKHFNFISTKRNIQSAKIIKMSIAAACKRESHKDILLC